MKSVKNIVGLGVGLKTSIWQKGHGKRFLSQLTAPVPLKVRGMVVSNLTNVIAISIKNAIRNHIESDLK